MKKLMSLSILFLLTTCSESPGEVHEVIEETPPIVEKTPSTDEETQQEDVSSENTVLIAYFTWADNTIVENPEEVDVDARTSASLLPPGNAGKLAQWIHEEVGGDIFQIKTVHNYSSDYDLCLEEAADEKALDARPELVNHVENMDQYDTIILGFPNWWYTTPMAVLSFVEAHDLEGKTIIPFVTHGTGGLSSTITDLENHLPTVDLEEPFSVYRPEVDDAKDDIQEWIRQFEIKTTRVSPTQVLFKTDDLEFVIELYDNETSHHFLEMLPLTLTFSDYASTEKVSDLEETLTIDEDISGFDPSIGDLTLYAPWGNLALFYEDFSYSSGLVPIGKIVSNLDDLNKLEDSFEATLELISNN